MPPGELAALVERTGPHPAPGFDEAIAKAGDPGFDAAPYLAQEAVSDASQLDPVIDAIIAANPGQVAAFKGGKDGLLGFFVGQVMKETGGTAESEGRQRARAREAARLNPTRAGIISGCGVS